MTEGTSIPEPEKRTCTRCGETKPVTAFHRAGPGKWRPRCAQCRAATRPSEAGRRRSYAAQRRDVLQRYGITLAQYEMMLQAQGGACAICKRSPEEAPRLAVDHCHKSGRVRAILCYGCNRWLGVYEKFRGGISEYDNFLAKYGDGNPLLNYDAA